MLVHSESRGLALARGFIVLIMPAVHTVLVYSNDSVKSGWIGTILGFLAEQPGAQLFMLQMGLFIGIGRSKTMQQVTRRFMLLLLSGYTLNFLRLVLPYWWGGLPGTFLLHNQIKYTTDVALQLFLVGDILQFAALGYLFCQMTQRFLPGIYLKIVLLIVLLVISPLTWSLRFSHPVCQYTWGLFNGLPPQVFFPFFPWICYPVAGLIMAQIVNQTHQRFKLPFWIFVSVLSIVGGYAISTLEAPSWNNNFYRLGVGGTIFHLGAAIAWTSLFIFLAQKVRSNIGFAFIERLSSNITPIYLLQWIIIIWLIPLFGFNKLGSSATIVAIGATTWICFGFSFFLRKNKPKHSLGIFSINKKI